MLSRSLKLAASGLALLALAACNDSIAQSNSAAPVSPAASNSEVKPPFSGPNNVAYAKMLWSEMQRMRLVGPNAWEGTAYEGQEPHGMSLVTIDGIATIAGHTGPLLVKRNYGGPGVSPEAVNADPGKWLKAVTVMFKREAGYDNDNQNWYWAKYLPDGTLDKNPKGMQLAGRVAKGADVGCIACHAAAPGGDFVYKHDRYK